MMSPSRASRLEVPGELVTHASDAVAATPKVAAMMLTVAPVPGLHNEMRNCKKKDEFVFDSLRAKPVVNV
jgi:hypothetical protein